MMRYVDQELTVEDMLADPIVQTLMRYDGISASDVRHTIEQAARKRPANSAPDRLPRFAPSAKNRRLDNQAA